MPRIFLKYKIPIFAFTATVFLVLAAILITKSPSITKEEYAQKIFETCKNFNNKNSCYTLQFKLLTSQKDLFYAQSTIKSLQKLDPQTNFCHGLAHTISTEEVSKDPEKWLELLSKVSIDDCSRGYFHGIFEGYMRANNDFEISAASINNVCNELLKNQVEPQKSKIQRNCPHAMGHLLLVEKSGDLKAAIDECQKTGPDFKRYCYIGVFMEDSQKENLITHGLAKDNLIDKSFIIKSTTLCNSHDGEISHSCWQSLGEVLGKYFMNPQLVFENCQNAKSSPDKKTCYLFGISSISINLATHKSTQTDLNFCQVFKNLTEYRECISQVITYTLNTSESFKDFLYNFCQAAKEDDKKFCHDKIKNFAK